MSHRLCLASLLLLALAPRLAAARPAPAVARFAIVIGNNQPNEKGSEPLRFADDDAVATHQLLLDAGVESHLLVTLDANTKERHPNLSPDGAPRVQDLERVFASISREMRAVAAHAVRTELLLFYSGHGDAEHGEGYVVLEDRHLTRSRLFDLLRRSPAKTNHVIVDACKSYFLVYAKGPGGRRTKYSGEFVDGVPGELVNTGFVLSTSSDRDSHEWTRYDAGIFSHELRSALRGAADADHDGQISYAELGAFLTVANGSVDNWKYRPDFLVRAPGSARAGQILGWGEKTASIRVTGELGHLYVETAEGERLLDVHPAAGELAALHLPELRPLFVRKNDGTAEYALIAARPEGDGPVSLSPRVPDIGSRGAIHLALTQLFASPFGAANVREFELVPVQPAEHRDAVAVPARGSLGTIAGWVAIGAGGAALSLSAASLATSLSNQGGSQVEIDQHNQQVKTLNIASAVGYALAGIAGVTWGLSRLHVGASPGTAAGSQRAHDARLTLELDGRF